MLEHRGRQPANTPWSHPASRVAYESPLRNPTKAASSPKPLSKSMASVGRGSMRWPLHCTTTGRTSRGGSKKLRGNSFRASDVRKEPEGGAVALDHLIPSAQPGSVRTLRAPRHGVHGAAPINGVHVRASVDKGTRRSVVGRSAGFVQGRQDVGIARKVSTRLNQPRCRVAPGTPGGEREGGLAHVSPLLQVGPHVESARSRRPACRKRTPCAVA